LKELTGTIQSADGKSLTLRIDIPHVEPNPNFKPNNNNSPSTALANDQARHMQNLARLQGNLARAKTPQARQSAMNSIMVEQQRLSADMARDMKRLVKSKNSPNNSPYKVTLDHKDFDLDFADKITVRKMFLETGYDDKGNLIEYTKDKIAKLKGDDTKLPGFVAKFDEMESGVMAKVMLIPVANPAKKSKDDDPLVGAVDKPTIRLVLLLQEKKEAATMEKGKKK